MASSSLCFEFSARPYKTEQTILWRNKRNPMNFLSASAIFEPLFYIFACLLRKHLRFVNGVFWHREKLERHQLRAQSSCFGQKAREPKKINGLNGFFFLFFFFFAGTGERKLGFERERRRRGGHFWWIGCEEKRKNGWIWCGFCLLIIISIWALLFRIQAMSETETGINQTAMARPESFLMFCYFTCKKTGSSLQLLLSSTVSFPFSKSMRIFSLFTATQTFMQFNLNIPLQFSCLDLYNKLLKLGLFLSFYGEFG